jgi:hypothetical protein
LQDYTSTKVLEFGKFQKQKLKDRKIKCSKKRVKENERIVRGLQKLVQQFGLAYNLCEQNKQCMLRGYSDKKLKTNQNSKLRRA